VRLMSSNSLAEGGGGAGGGRVEFGNRVRRPKARIWGNKVGGSSCVKMR